MQDFDSLNFNSPLIAYKPGDIMKCKIVSKQAGGYNLVLPDGDIREAFLPTSVHLFTGDYVEVFFVCTDGKRIFLSMTEEEFRKRMQLRAEKLDQYPS